MKYYLENEFLSLTFDTLGGTLTSIKNPLGVEYLWLGDPAYWSSQAPVLFPICGSLRNDKAITRDGSEMKMPRHGLVRKKAFEFANKDWNMVAFRIRSTPELLEAYPFEFELTIEYRLIGKEIVVNYFVKNLNPVDMPFAIGGHPGFNCPINEGESFDDCYIEFEHEESCTVPTPLSETGLIDAKQRSPFLNKQTVLPLSHDMFKEDAMILDRIQSRKVSLKSKKSDNSVTLEFKDFPFLILWSSPNDGPFVAIEPWSGLSTCEHESDIFEEKINTQVVKSGQINKYSYSIIIG